MRSRSDVFLFIPLGMTLLHLLTIGLPPVNLEFAFADASQYFKNGDSRLLDQYFKYQANTIAIPYFGYLVSNLLNIEPLYALRTLSTFGLLAIVLSVRKIALFADLRPNLAFYIVLMLNPLIWTYSGRATADILPAAIALLSMSVLFDARLSWYRSFSAGVLFGAACSLKYHSIILFPLVFLILTIRLDWRKAMTHFLTFTAPSIAIVSIFIFMIYTSFGFILTPPAYQNIHSLGFNSQINNLLGYFGFLFLLAFPFSFFRDSFTQKEIPPSFYLALLSISLFSFFIGYLFLPSNGELDLGPLNRWISPQMSSGMLTLFASIGVFSLCSQIRSEHPNRNKILIITGIAVFIFVLSFTRPAQRYLIYVLPFFLLTLNHGLFKSNRIVIPTVVILFSVNTFVAYSQWCTGAASIKMVEHVISQDLISVTNPGDIEGHVGNYFKTKPADNYIYKVVAGRLPDAIYTTESPYTFGKKSYSLVQVK